MPEEYEKNVQAWDGKGLLSNSLRQDRFRVADLAQKVNEAMLAEEREKVRRRLGVGRSNAA